VGQRGWKVKIRDRERLETPHVTLLYKTRAWRFGLRSETFLDTESDPTEVPKDVVDQVLASLARPPSTRVGPHVPGEPDFIGRTRG